MDICASLMKVARIMDIRRTAFFISRCPSHWSAPCWGIVLSRARERCPIRVTGATTLPSRTRGEYHDDPNDGVSLRCRRRCSSFMSVASKRDEHYRDVLGFRTEFTYGQPTFYAGVERDGVVIHLQAADHTKRQPGQGAVNVFVTDVDALYQELKSRGARILNEPKDYPYGMRDFDVNDLDGNKLCFGMESKSS